MWPEGRSGPRGAEDRGPHKTPPQQELPALGAPLAASALGGGSGLNPLELSTHPLCSSSPQWIGHPSLTPGPWEFLPLAPFSSFVLKVCGPGPLPQIRVPQGSPGSASLFTVSVLVSGHIQTRTQVQSERVHAEHTCHLHQGRETHHTPRAAPHREGCRGPDCAAPSAGHHTRGWSSPSVGQL